MLRRLSAAATAGLLAVLGLGPAMSPASARPDATTSSGWERDIDPHAKCKVDSKAMLVVTKVGGAKPCAKPTESSRHTESAKPTESPKPTKSAKTESPKPTKSPAKPTESPTKSPTKAPTSPSVSPTRPAMPVTGTSTATVAGIGLTLLGAGALTLLAARRRRAL